MIILGIDPGTQVTGYGLIDEKRGQSLVLASGCLRARRSDLMAERLHDLFEQIEQVVHTHHPEVMAIEQAFFAKNAASALKLGQCRGITMLAAARARLPVYEYSPRAIKQAVTGSGQATKEQIQKMVTRRLALTAVPASDAADALAVALCHAQSYCLQRLSGQAVPQNMGGVP